VTLQINHNDSDLTVETTILRGAAVPRNALQHHRTDGKTSVSTGPDGDEFHTSVVWSGRDLVFSMEEHEDGRIILSKETWTLSEDRAALERTRERTGDQAGKQTIIYHLRQAPKA
jgi:hypothetical protein